MKSFEEFGSAVRAHLAARPSSTLYSAMTRGEMRIFKTLAEAEAFSSIVDAFLNPNADEELLKWQTQLDKLKTKQLGDWTDALYTECHWVLGPRAFKKLIDYVVKTSQPGKSLDEIGKTVIEMMNLFNEMNDDNGE